MAADAFSKRSIVSILLLLYIFLSPLHATRATSHLYLMPEQKEAALDAMLREIDLAKHSIKITIYNFTHKKIANKLKHAAKRGVKIEIIFDEKSSHEQRRHSMLYYLAKYRNITVYRLKGRISQKGDYYGKMHIKAAIIDNKTVIFGSANWSYSAFGLNYEILYITRDYALAKKMNRYFETLKKQSRLFK